MSIYDTRLRGRNFRLLNLLPGDETSPLRCDLFESSLDRPVAYEALSYVWGDISATEPIFCGGRTLSITASLAEALRSLRSKHSRRVLWADGICINQRDLEERSHQVQLMGRVYANAGRVIAWLGPDHDDIG
ncbi:HET-domain-containing protein, partial [Ophiobolus disseminans]